METFFRYNWIVREQWYEWCVDLPEEELLCPRTGGVGSILQTLFHIVDVEWSWIRILQGKPDDQENFDDYATLQKVRELDQRFKPEVEAFVAAWNDSMETRVFYDYRPDGSVDMDAWGEVMRHIIAHQIHHMGQLSVWAREKGIQKNPISPNVIGKNLIAVQQK
ncbi:DinB family protein [Paenibacillus gallinarum]|uniref:DinB family protein n=1 Tax=Paenibacillus gallinarum TaxID=2762232 RepID=A0ABR8STC0_9BACL|nr:DinB family protein [Paenibacillus gallinarum]MBD7966743.1 DinB family protein [Paenibacillus gallinarum]